MIWKPIVIDESELVCEMSNKNKAKTHLPMNIWIDEAQTYRKGGHSKIIKFQLNHSNKMNLTDRIRKEAQPKGEVK